jgi:hypothetical protein
LNQVDGDNKAEEDIAGLFFTLELRGVFSSNSWLLCLGGVLEPLLVCWMFSSCARF